MIFPSNPLFAMTSDNKDTAIFMYSFESDVSILDKGNRLKYQGFSKMSEKNAKTLFLLNNSTTQSFSCFCSSAMFPLNVLYSSFNRNNSILVPRAPRLFF